MEPTIEIRNGRRCSVEPMRRDADGNVTSEFVEPLPDEPDMVLHNQPPFLRGEDPAFLDNMPSEPDVPVLNVQFEGGPVQNGVPVLEPTKIEVSNKKQTGNDNANSGDVPTLETPTDELRRQ